ncbi:MAG: class II fructose-bisphosphate aldolase [Planctomycetia bacterium]|nr:class II fructose-bisphosphate aldolase [Planctomycetia bacterium]
MSMTSAEIIRSARQSGLAIPAFNIPYLPMVEPVIRAVVDEDAFAFVVVARPEWIKFESKGPTEVRDEFAKWDDPEHVRLHLDHIPVIDEDNLRVDYLPIITEAISVGYQSVMIDGSRLDLEENIACTKQVADLAHEAGIACEAELGAVLGHEEGPLPSYEELFASGRGFTDVEEARRFVRETGTDWLSVAVGTDHGGISKARKDCKKVEARINLEHLERLVEAAGVPLVLHGGSSVIQEYILKAVKRGIAKINVATEIRQPYERVLKETGKVSAAKDAVYERTRWVLKDYLQLSGISGTVLGK